MGAKQPSPEQPQLATAWPRLPVSASGWVVLRTPLLPFEELVRWSDGLRSPGAREPAELEQAYRADVELLRQRLRAWLERPEVLEALYLASPGLQVGVPVWREAPDSEQGLKLERALCSYLARMAGRATPFALFGGYSLGELAPRSRLRLGGLETYRRRSQLGLSYLGPLARALESLSGVWRSLCYHPNTSLHRLQGEWRFIQTQLLPGGERQNQLATAPCTDYLDATIERARGGASGEELVQALTRSMTDVSEEEAAEYLQTLVEAQVLQSELTPTATGEPPARAMASTLARLPGLEREAEALRTTLGALEVLDASPPGCPPARHEEALRPLRALPVEPEGPRALRVDLVKPAPGLSLGTAPLAEVTRGLKILQRVGASPPSEKLRAFREAFLARYEAREVPLLEVLDDETGIGFGSSTVLSAPVPLLKGLNLFSPSEEPARLERRHRHLIDRLEAVQRTGAAWLELEEADVAALEQGPSRPLPGAFMAMVKLAAESEEALDAGRFQVFVGSTLGPSGARILGRFCQDPALRQRVEAHLRAEEALHPGALLAELAHLPNGRVAEMVLRPVLREYELPFFGRSGVPLEKQIPVEELLVSVVGERIVLRSARLDREILPRLSHGHVFGWRGNHALYQFLGELQAQDTIESLRWNWGPLDALPFLPRVVSGRAVFSLARWRVPGALLEPAVRARGARRFQALRELRETLQLPRYITVGQADNLLPVDLDNALSIEPLLHQGRVRSELTIRELFPGPDGLVTRGPEGRFIHELVIPFVRTTQGPAPARPPPVSARRQERSFLPGSEWLHAKLYAGPQSLDRLLVEGLSDVLRRLVEAGAVDQWFFIRYADPDWHLRVRLHGPPARLASEALPALHEAVEALREEGLVWRLQLDTYEREVERYGGLEGVEQAERLFHADSEAVMALLAQAAEAGGLDEELRWRLAYLGIDRLLGALGFGLEEKLSVLETLSEGYRAEFKVEGALERQLGMRYRAERATLPELFTPPSGEEKPWAEAERLFAHRTGRIAPIAAELRRLEAEGRLSQPLRRIAASYVHMFADRLLSVELRAQELVLYDFLRRTYGSRIARSRLDGPPSP